MFERSLLCATVLGVMSVGALASAATTNRAMARNSGASVQRGESANAIGGRDQALIARAVSVMHDGKHAQAMQSLAGSNNPQCNICH